MTILFNSGADLIVASLLLFSAASRFASDRSHCVEINLFRLENCEDPDPEISQSACDMNCKMCFYVDGVLWCIPVLPGEHANSFCSYKKMMAGKWVHNEGENKCVMFTESRGINDSVRINRITDDRSMWFIFFLILQIWWTCWLSESNFFFFFSFIFRLLEQEIRMDFTRGHTSCHFQANSYICDNTLPHYVCILDFSLSVRNVFAVCFYLI